MLIKKPVLFQLFVVQALFALNPVSAKWAFGGFSPLLVLFFRLGVSALVLQFIAKIVLGRWPIVGWSIREHLRLNLLAFLGVVANQGFFLFGVSITSAVNASLIMAAIPALSLGFAVLLGQESFAPRKLFSLVLAFAGILILMLSKGEIAGAGLGDLFLLINAGCYALYLVLAKPMLEEHPPIQVMGAVFFWSVIQGVGLYLSGFEVSLAPSVSVLAWSGLLILVFAGTIMTYAINALALRKVDSSLAAFFTFLQPVFGAALAIVFLGEKMGLHHHLALAAVLGGLLLRAMGGRRIKWMPGGSI